MLFEICNEPNINSSWDDVKKYANIIIPIIREHSDNVIIVGTTTWSQDVDIAANDPLNYENLMYALHFYSSTHKQELRDKCENAIKKGLPVFISEFGVCEASGNGYIDYEEAYKWFCFIKKYNLSHLCWNMSNRAEASAILKPNVNTLTSFNDLDYTESGLIYKKHFNGI